MLSHSFLGDPLSFVARTKPFVTPASSRRHRHPGQGLSYLCHRDKVYWMTKKKLVHDMAIQDYAVHRCMQQFGLRQEFPMPFANWVPSFTTWAPQWSMTMKIQKMEPWLQQWSEAEQDTVQEDRTYDPSTYQLYLQWYVPRTRTRLLCV